MNNLIYKDTTITVGYYSEYNNWFIVTNKGFRIRIPDDVRLINLPDNCRRISQVVKYHYENYRGKTEDEDSTLKRMINYIFTAIK